MKIGLVLAGGGGKGAYQIGAIRALMQLGIAQKIEAVAGTSVGALNGALFVNQNVALAEQMWRTISPNKILSIKSEKLLPVIANIVSEQHVQQAANYTKKLEGYGIFSRDGLLQMMKESINLANVSVSTRLFYVTCTDVEKKRATYFRMNGLMPTKMEQILLASSAIPGIFGRVTIDVKDYVDGGLVDNIPVQPLYELGCDVMIVVLLDRAAIIRKEDFPSARIIEIVPQRKQGNILTGTLNFNQVRADLRMQEGYEDTMAILRPIVAIWKNEQRFFYTAQQLVKEDQVFQRQHQLHQNDFQQSVQALVKLIEGEDDDD